jgi:plasma kallikrein
MLHSKQKSNNYAQFAEFPWMIAGLVLRNLEDGETLVYEFGGSLISEKAVLTAAHAISGKNPRKIVLRAGEWNLENEKEMPKHQDRNIANIFVHQEFDRLNLLHNVALLIADNNFDLTAHVNTICLPTNLNYVGGDDCLVTGWGKDKFGEEGTYQKFLKKIDMPVVAKRDCEEKISKTVLGPDFKLKEGKLCAGGQEGKDACTGDGGSPLVCEMEYGNSVVYFQVGIVASALAGQCGQKDVPAFYTKVSE